MPSPLRLALVAGAVLALVAAGCGGSSSDKKASETYANSVCSAVGDWEQQIKKIATDFSGGISKASLQKKVDQAQAATKTLVSEIKAVPPPDTDEGKAAKQQIAQVSDDATSTIDAAKSAVGQIQGDASPQAIAAAVAGLLPQVQSLVSEAKSTISALQSAKGSLASAFKSAEACKSLT
jgi:hypothetical protein